MATVKLTPEQAAEELYATYAYELKDGELIATAPQDAAGYEPFVSVIPQELPLNRNGDPFIPGIDCYDSDGIIELDYTATTGRPCDDCAIDVATGSFSVNSDSEKPFFRLLHPDLSAHTLLAVQYKKGSCIPDLITPESELGQKLHVVATWRINNDPECQTYLCTDYIVLEYADDELFKTSRQMMCGWIAEEIAAGDVYANTCRAVQPIYRAHMENVLLPQYEALSDRGIHCEFGEDKCEVYTTSGNGDPQLLNVYPYTLEGAQNMARNITAPHRS